MGTITLFYNRFEFYIKKKKKKNAKTQAGSPLTSKVYLALLFPERVLSLLGFSKSVESLTVPGWLATFGIICALLSRPLSALQPRALTLPHLWNRPPKTLINQRPQIDLCCGCGCTSIPSSDIWDSYSVDDSESLVPWQMRYYIFLLLSTPSLSFAEFWKWCRMMIMMMVMMMMLMNCFCGMVNWRKVFSLISSRDHCQRSSPSRISDTPQAQTCAESEFRLSWMKLCSRAGHYTTASQTNVDI